ncbi:PE domain-containing protein [Mycobacterium haemophilum]|uniref:PE domain-containing protein n=1 Tax=Mycobacterium haemophilum TaxID=29311 RepID=UPI000A3EC0F2|nr:PE domain-containing protein [Mycobacterium haemophilum]
MSFVAVNIPALRQSAVDLRKISEDMRDIREAVAKSVVPPAKDCVSQLVASSLLENVVECHHRISQAAKTLDLYALNLLINVQAYENAETDNTQTVQ